MIEAILWILIGIGAGAVIKFIVRWMEKSQQRQWVGLSDEEIEKIRNTPMAVEGGVGFNIYSYARAIEAKLKEKNT